MIKITFSKIDYIKKKKKFKNNKIFIILILIFLSFLSGILFHDAKFAYKFKQLLIKRSIVLDNFLLSNKIKDLKKLKIDLPFKTSEYLEKNSIIALKYNDLNYAENSFKPINISFDNSNIRARIRLKGLTNYHRIGQKPSYRVRIKRNENEIEKSFLGMSSFSLMDPKRRSNEREWFFREVAYREGLIKKRYDFIELQINDDSKKIYAIEEDYKKEFFEFNKIKPAPIIHLDTEKLQGLEKFNSCCYAELVNNLNFSPAQSEDQIKTNANYKNQYIFSKNQISRFIIGEIKPDKILDLEKFAKFLALSDLFGGWHGTQTFSLRFYFNPYQRLLEPIPDDMFDEPRDKPIRDFAIFKIRSLIGYSVFYEKLFDDDDFLKLYYYYLTKYTERDFLNKIFQDYNETLTKKIGIIVKDDISYRSTIKENLLNNSKLIKEFISPKFPIEVFEISLDENNTYEIKLKNNFYFPINVNKIIINNVPVHLNKVLEAKKLSLSSILENQSYEINKRPKILKFKFKSEIELSNIDDLKINYSIADQKNLQKTMIVKNMNIYDKFDKFSENINDFKDQLVIDYEKREIQLATEKLVISNNLILPKNYNFYIKSGSKIILEKNSSLIINSKFTTKNTDNRKIVFSAMGDNCLFFNGSEVFLKNVSFEGFSDCQSEGHNLTGGINFYKTKLKIINSIFKNNKSGDDLINIIKSEFSLSNIILENSLFDGLDIDFSNGLISGMRCINCGKQSGGDALDLSGSKVFIKDIDINFTADKGISIGENSSVNILNAKINNSKICIANKDGSQTKVSNAVLTNCEIGVAAFTKKNYYDFSSIELLTIELNNNKFDYLRDQKNKIINNGYLIIDKKYIDENLVRKIYE